MSQNINLYDPVLRARRDVLGPGMAFGIVAAALVAVVAVTGLARGSLAGVAEAAARSTAELQMQQAAMKTVAERATAQKPDPSVQNEIALTQRVLLQRRSALQTLEAGSGARSAGFAQHLEALARQSIEGLWLTGVVLRQDNVLLRGRALNPALIPAYVQRLEHEPSLQGRSFRSLEVSRPAESAAASASQPRTESEAASTPQHAAFVEFKLTGAGPELPPAVVGKP